MKTPYLYQSNWSSLEHRSFCISSLFCMHEYYTKTINLWQDIWKGFENIAIFMLCGLCQDKGKRSYCLSYMRMKVTNYN